MQIGAEGVDLPGLQEHPLDDVVTRETGGTEVGVGGVDAAQQRLVAQVRQSIRLDEIADLLV